jgi:AbrB family transcriptional regulator (stage V sporulation protein T)
MKATGIVRRIDDLGRVVIPKEIRRTLRIREADPLEIFTDREGEIILKKYSPIGEMGTFAKQYADSIAQVSGHIALISDRDQFIAVAGGMKNLLGKNISSQLEDVIENAAALLVPGGHFYMVHRPFRLAEIITTLTKYRLEPKRMQLVYPYIDKEPNMVLIEAVRGGKSRMQVEKPLIVYEKPGVYTQEIYDVYGY